MVRFTREQGGFSVGVAGFPEGHVACKAGKFADWQYLKEKVETGADFVLTQLSFDNADYFAFRDHVAGKPGVRAPLVPGIVTILSSSHIKKFTQLCGARIPLVVSRKLDQFTHDEAACAEFGIKYATRQCEELLRAGVPGLHFYTLNKAASNLRVLQNLGLAGAAT